MPDYVQGSSSNSAVPAGIYPFKVKSAKEKQSAAGNIMIELVLEIEGGSQTYDNLVFVKTSYWKIDDFRKSTGEKIEPGVKVSFEAEDCVDRSGLAELEIDVWEGKQLNKVVRYVESAVPPPVPPKFNEHGEPDNIPF